MAFIWAISHLLLLYINSERPLLSLESKPSSSLFTSRPFWRENGNIGGRKNTDRNYNNGSGRARRELGSGGGGVLCMEEEHAVFVRSDRLSPVGVAVTDRSLGTIFVSATVSGGPHLHSTQACARNPHIR